MKKNLLWITIFSIAFVFSGCSGQPSVSNKGGYSLDESKTIAPKANGKLNGVVKKYAANGQPWSVETYVNGVKNGPATYYSMEEAHFMNGNAWIKEEVSYKNGKKNGISKKYNAALNLRADKNNLGFIFLRMTTTYSNGKIIGTRKIYEQNHNTQKIYLMASIPFKNGEVDGVKKEWEDGKGMKVYLKKTTTYKNGLKNGQSLTYWADTGKLKVKTRYKNNIEVGPQYTYYPNETNVVRFDKASVRAKEQKAQAENKEQRQAACRYVKRNGANRSSSTFIPQKFEDAKTICKYGNLNGAYTTPYTFY